MCRHGFLSPAVFCLFAALAAGTAVADNRRPAIRISTDQPALTHNLEVMLDVSNELCDADAGRKRLLERNLLRKATDAAQAVGYYQPQFNLRFEQTPRCWLVVLEAQAGEPVRLREVSVTLVGDAEDDSAFAELIRLSELKPGNVLSHNDYQSLRDGLLRMASQRGYFDHQLREHRLEVDPTQYSARVTLLLDSGVRYRFGQFSLYQDVLEDDRALRYLRFKQGDFWDNDLLLGSQQALLGSGYYTTARLERGEADPLTREVPATLHLTVRPQYAWTAGVGISTDTGPRLRLGVENRYVNRQGHRWRADSEVSALTRIVSSSYEIPYRDPVRDRIMLSTGYKYENTESAESEQVRVGASLISGIGGGWVLTRSVDYERENFTVADQTETTELVMPGIQLQKTRGNHPIYPRRGWKIGAALRGTHPAISTTEEFLQARLWTKAIVPLGPSRLLARVEAGQTAVNDVSTLPASVRFFAGGDSSIRGFSYQALGPVDANGDVIGGRSLLTGGIEMDFAVHERWHPAIFSDAGNAFNDSDEMNLRVSAGVGLRWRSPLGPIRIDVARPVDAARNWRLHLSMGPDL
jgi:translocation and assembly module TamA